MVTELNTPDKSLSAKKPPRFFTNAVPTKNNKKIRYEMI
jgi:hypothetical protein